jgi:hypothetical protein
MPLIGRLRFKAKSQRLVVRLLFYAILAVAGLAVLYLSISYVAVPLLILLSPTLHPTLYELGLYGGAPSQTYLSNGLSSPRISIRKSDPQCDKAYTFLNLNGGSMASPGPAILDANGGLVWKTEGLGATTNLKLQTYKGEQYVTFWTGKKGGTMGRGVYHMVSAENAPTHSFARMVLN